MLQDLIKAFTPPQVLYKCAEIVFNSVCYKYIPMSYFSEKI